MVLLIQGFYDSKGKFSFIIKNKDETERIDTSETEPLFTISVENKALNNPNNEISFDQVWFA